MTDSCPCTTSPPFLQPLSTFRDPLGPSTYTQLPAPIQHEDSWSPLLLAFLPQFPVPGRPPLWLSGSVAPAKNTHKRPITDTLPHSSPSHTRVRPVSHSCTNNLSPSLSLFFFQSLTLSFSFVPPVTLTSPCSPEPQQNVRPVEHSAPSPCRASRVPRRARVEMIRQRQSVSKSLSFLHINHNNGNPLNIRRRRQKRRRPPNRSLIHTHSSCSAPGLGWARLFLSLSRLRAVSHRSRHQSLSILSHPSLPSIHFLAPLNPCPSIDHKLTNSHIFVQPPSSCSRATALASEGLGLVTSSCRRLPVLSFQLADGDDALMFAPCQFPGSLNSPGPEISRCRLTLSWLLRPPPSKTRRAGRPTIASK